MSLILVLVIVLLLLLAVLLEALFMPRLAASAAVSPDGDDTEDAQMDSAA